MKASKYNMVWNLENGDTLAFNGTSCALAKIDDAFLNTLEDISHINYDTLKGKDKDLVDNMLLGNYIYGNDFDEIKALKFRHLSGKFNDDCLSLTIAPTFSCNLDCTYCHKSTYGSNMHKSIQDSIINWVSEESIRKKDIHIQWIGGEPLLATSIILSMSEKIISACRKNNSYYRASMVTNGYLLNNETITLLKAAEIDSVQITLDGPTDVHNLRRPLKKGSCNTFDKILSNIIELRENRFAITVRMNTDNTSIHYIEEFLDILSQYNLKDIPVNFSSAAGIKKACISAAQSCMSTSEHSAENLKYQQMLFQKGFNAAISNNTPEFYPGIKKNNCSADNTGTFILDPEGYMYKCLRDMGEDEKAVGSILTVNTNSCEKMLMKNIDYLSWSPFEHEECLRCTLLPICMGGCPNEGLNNNFTPICNRWKHILEESIKFTYLTSQPEDSNSSVYQYTYTYLNENSDLNNANLNNQNAAENEVSHKIGLNMVGWEITQRCNLTCKHCYTSAAAAGQKVPEMPASECCRIIEEFARLGVKVIGWTGGEPLLRNDLEYLIAYAKASGISSGLTTNGLLLNESRALKLKESGLDFIQVSLDGSTPARNSRIRNCKESDFDLVLNGIRNSLKMGIPTNMAMLLCAETLEDAPKYIELAKQLGVGIVRFCGFVPTGRGKETEITSRFLFSGTHLSRLRNFIETALQEKDISIIFDPAFGSLPPYHYFHSCNAGVDQLYLDTQGNIYPCTSMIDQQFLAGNIRAQSIEEIYNGERMRPMCNFSEASLKGRCASCSHLANCHGGCRGIVLAHTGNINSSFPYCLKQL